MRSRRERGRRHQQALPVLECNVELSEIVIDQLREDIETDRVLREEGCVPAQAMLFEPVIQFHCQRLQSSVAARESENRYNIRLNEQLPCHPSGRRPCIATLARLACKRQ